MEKTILKVWEKELKPAFLWYMFSQIFPDKKISMQEFIKKFNEESPISKESKR